MDGHNPYAPPTVAVGDVRHTFAAERPFNPEGRSVPAGQGWDWYKSAWQIFKQQPFMFWVAIIAVGAVFIVISLIPIVNLITTIAMPAVVAGFGVCARNVQRTGRFELGQVFEGFQKRLGTQLLAGLLYLVALFVGIGILAVAFGASGLFSVFMGGMKGSEAAASVFGSLGVAFFLAYFVVLAIVGSTIAFAPYIIQETELSAPQAMVASLKGALKNIPAFVVAIVVYLLLFLLSIVTIGLGFLVLIPVVFLSVFVAYDEIYYG